MDYCKDHWPDDVLMPKDSCHDCKIDQLTARLAGLTSPLKRLAAAVEMKASALKSGITSDYLRAVREINDATEECVAIGKEL